MTYYTSGEFAKKSNVSIRTIRYYDQKNLLKPAIRSVYLPQINKTAILLIMAVILCRLNVQNWEFDDIIS